MTFYGEWDTFAAAWLRELMVDGLIPNGVVDERDIRDVKAEGLKGYTHCHFFAGIGGWAEALQLAGWPATRPVWTASCPCQPFSVAGKQKGEEDERHLWPVLAALVRQCQPDCIFGEQVDSADGREWLDGVRIDLEAEGYTFGAASLCAAGAGAPHIRSRLFWVAHSRRASIRDERQPLGGTPGGDQGAGDQRQRVRPDADAACTPRGVFHPASDGRQPRGTESDGRDADAACTPGGVGDTSESGPQGRQLPECGRADERAAGPAGCPPAGRFWDRYRLIPCLDGKLRRTEPGIFPLDHGIRNRVGTLRGAGNAIVPQVAAAFIRAFLDVERGLI